jgi:hypothetical protein
METGGKDLRASNLLKKPCTIDIGNYMKKPPLVQGVGRMGIGIYSSSRLILLVRTKGIEKCPAFCTERKHVMDISQP